MRAAAGYRLEVADLNTSEALKIHLVLILKQVFYRQIFLYQVDADLLDSPRQLILRQSSHSIVLYVRPIFVVVGLPWLEIDFENLEGCVDEMACRVKSIVPTSLLFVYLQNYFLSDLKFSFLEAADVIYFVGLTHDLLHHCTSVFGLHTALIGGLATSLREERRNIEIKDQSLIGAHIEYTSLCLESVRVPKMKQGSRNHKCKLQLICYILLYQMSLRLRSTSNRPTLLDRFDNPTQNDRDLAKNANLKFRESFNAFAQQTQAQVVVDKHRGGVKRINPTIRKFNEIEQERSRYDFKTGFVSNEMPECFRSTQHWYQRNDLKKPSLGRQSYETDIFGRARDRSFLNCHMPRLSLVATRDPPKQDLAGFYYTKRPTMERLRKEQKPRTQRVIELHRMKQQVSQKVGFRERPFLGRQLKQLQIKIGTK